MNEPVQMFESPTKNSHDVCIYTSCYLNLVLCFLWKKKNKIKRETQGGYDSVTDGDTIYLESFVQVNPCHSDSDTT